MNLRTLEPRLENWARAQLSGGWRGEDIGSIEGRYRKHAPEASTEPNVDVDDAALVNAAWRRCMPLDKRILQMYYVWCASAGYICRKVGIKQGRQHAHVWDFALYHAQKAIDAQLAAQVQSGASMLQVRSVGPSEESCATARENSLQD